MKYFLKFFLSAFIGLFTGEKAICQSEIADTLIQRFNDYRENHSQEKLYAHCDRNTYLTGETLWFKIYSIDGALHKPMNVSKVVYVEITDQNNVSVLQAKIGMNGGMGDGSFFLPASLLTGNYFFRAYTKWMRNANPEFFFRREITIINPFRPLDLKQNTQQPTADYQVNFYPEGGSLLNELESKVAYSIKDNNGKGIDCRVAVVNEKNDTLITSRTERFGLGYFLYTPHLGSQDKVLVITKNGQVTTHRLPEASDKGYSLQIIDSARQLQVAVKHTFKNQLPWVFLFVHARQIVTHAELKQINSNQAVFLVDKDKLEDGVSHITLFDENLKPVAERLYFKYPQKKLTVTAESSKKDYTTRSKVTLHVISADDKRNNKAQLSVSVYKSDSLNVTQRHGIFEHLWLSSDLTGLIESPEYYFSHDDKAQKALDLVMLTHGWRRFRWHDVINRNQIVRFTPEYFSHIIKGKVTASDGSAVADAKTYLSSPDKLIRTYSDISDNSGNVKFELKDYFGPHQLIAKANHYRGPVKVNIENPYAENHIPYKTRQVKFEPSMKRALTARNLFMQVQDIYDEDAKRRFKAPSLDSSAFYGAPQQTFYLDDYTRFPVMEEVLREYVPGIRVRKHNDQFNFVVVDNTTNNILGGEPLILLDGVPISHADDIMAFDPRKVKKLEVVTKRFYLGPIALNGIVSYSTYEGNLAGFPLDPQALIIDYDGLQLQREFYLPNYDTPERQNSKLPDFRNLMAWFPTVETDENGQVHLDFYTSDLKGDYTVVVEGISEGGYAGTGYWNFSVK